MTRNHHCMLAIILTVLLNIVCSVSADASLIDRGGGLIYDTQLNITWLQDANYVQTTGYDASLYGSNYFGQLTWRDAKQWADGLSYYDPIRNVYWDDWRLPKTLPINPPFYDLSWSYKGTTDRGFNILSPNSELSYLYYVILGNLGAMSIEGVRPQTGWGLHETGPFQNIALSYWSGSEFVSGNEVAYFSMFNGEQLGKNTSIGGSYMYAWAVRDGDVAIAPVPEPATMLLFGTGIAGLACSRLKRKKE